MAEEEREVEEAASDAQTEEKAEETGAEKEAEEQTESAESAPAKEKPGRSAKKKPGKKEKAKLDVKIFGRWDSNITVNDPGLAAYINLEPKLLPRSAGAYRSRFHKSKMHIAERLALHMMVTGHAGKRHRLSSGRFGGGFYKALSIVEDAFALIEKKGSSPVETLVRALENAAMREEVISYQLGSIMARESVITAPQRRVDKALRYFCQGAYRKSFGKKKRVHEALAEELLAASQGSMDSHAIREKDRIEKEAGGAR